MDNIIFEILSKRVEINKYGELISESDTINMNNINSLINSLSKSWIKLNRLTFDIAAPWLEIVAYFSNMEWNPHIILLTPLEKSYFPVNLDNTVIE